MPRARKFGTFLAMNITIAALGSACPSTAQKARMSENGDGGTALAATINGPVGIAIDEDGSLFVVESNGFRVRRIDARTRVITTVAGNGKHCCFDENLPATESALHYPVAVSIDHEHNLYIGDTLARIKRVDATSGRMRTVVRQKLTSHGGSDPGEAPSFDDAEQIKGLAVNPTDSTATIYAVGYLGHIYKIRDGSITIMPVFDRSASITNTQVGPRMVPAGVAVDAIGNIFVADYQNCRILRVESGTSDLFVVAGTGECKPSEDGSARLTSFEPPTAIAVDPKGDVYFASADTQSCVRRIDYKSGLVKSILGTCETKSGKQGPPSGLAADSRGNIYFTLWGSNLVRKIDSETGHITTVAGNGLPDRRDYIQ